MMVFLNLPLNFRDGFTTHNPDVNKFASSDFADDININSNTLLFEYFGNYV